MKELVFQNSNGSDVTTSLIVAEVFGKNHKDVLRDIEKLSCSEDFRVRNFAHTPYMEQGLFEIKQTTINKPDGSVLVSTTTKVTGKGQVYFVNKILKEEHGVI